MNIKSRTELHQESLVKMFSALGDGTRFQIVNLLANNRNICVGEIADRLGVTDSAVSQHCRILEFTGIVEPKRFGQRKCYQIRTDDPLVQRVMQLTRPTRF